MVDALVDGQAQPGRFRIEELPKMGAALITPGGSGALRVSPSVVD
jgi:hypothetical protein